MILEDETLLRRCLTRLLERHGHEVVPAGSVEEARNLLRGRPVDAAILDVGLPDGNGLDLLPVTRVDRSLVVSADVSDEYLAERGVTHFLRKPLDLESVIDRIECFVGEGE
ncbi:MAG: response regulator [Myxococcota bacterium]|nr:response regulator [Myxococcota bacterium]